MGQQTKSLDYCKFKIQLLSDKSVVLVTVTGYESEIFVPQLKANRIILTNVVCSRQSKTQESETPIRSNRIANRRLITATAGLPPTPAVATASRLKLKFDIKLISNGNVVLVECNGYESEIFLPLISSRSVTMKRVSAAELTRYAWQVSINENLDREKDSAAALAASLAAQAVGLTKLLVSPTDDDMISNDPEQCQAPLQSLLQLPLQSSSLSQVQSPKEKPKKKSRLLLKAAGDAKIKEYPK